MNCTVDLHRTCSPRRNFWNALPASVSRHLCGRHRVVAFRACAGGWLALLGRVTTGQAP